jgi:hypothetical protein
MVVVTFETGLDLPEPLHRGAAPTAVIKVYPYCG